jgi:hypothetical protein
MLFFGILELSLLFMLKKIFAMVYNKGNIKLSSRRDLDEPNWFSIKNGWK